MSFYQIVFLVLLFLIIFYIYLSTLHKNSASKYPVGTKMLIFDFDGTIADSLPTLLESFNNHASYYRYKKIDNPELLRSRDTYEILKNSGISMLKLFFIAKTIRRDMHSKMASLKPFPDMVPILTQLHNQGVLLGIVTSNSKENVEKFLNDHKINFFDIIHGESSLFGKAKVLKHLLTNYGLDAARVIYIGDETRDIEAAQSNHIRNAGVTWGFNTAQKLQEKNPDYLITKPSELLALAQKL